MILHYSHGWMCRCIIAMSVGNPCGALFFIIVITYVHYNLDDYCVNT